MKAHPRTPARHSLTALAGCGASAASPRSPTPASLFSVWPGEARARSSRCRRTMRQTGVPNGVLTSVLA
ncbi:Basic proline-rich protein precursor [Actinosynnema pretiosum subsp. pretiosum]|nr:Basic proline-rich protein precursor [Actinosynnema pretiosum subsp. pretiosum]